MPPPYLSIIASQPRGQWTLVIVQMDALCKSSSSRLIFAPHLHLTSPLGHVSLCLSSFPRFIVSLQRSHSTLTSGQWRTWLDTSFTATWSLHRLHFTFIFFQQLFRESIAEKTDPLLSALVAVVFSLFLQCFRAVTTNWVATWIRGLCINHWIHTATNTRKYSQSIFELKRKLRFPWLTKLASKFWGEIAQIDAVENFSGSRHDSIAWPEERDPMR